MAEGQETEAAEANDQAYPGCATASAMRSPPPRGAGPRRTRRARHSTRPGQPREFTAGGSASDRNARVPYPVERRHGLPEAVDARPKSPWHGRLCRGIVCLRVQDDISAGRGEREGPWAAAMALFIRAHERSMDGHKSEHPSQPAPGRRTPRRGPRPRPDNARTPPYSAKRSARRYAKRGGDRWPAPLCRRLGQVREGLEGLLEGGHRLADARAVEGPGAGLLAVGHGLVPHLAPQSMVRQRSTCSAPRSGANVSRASTMRPCSARRRSCSRLP